MVSDGSPVTFLLRTVCPVKKTVPQFICTRIKYHISMLGYSVRGAQYDAVFADWVAFGVGFLQCDRGTVLLSHYTV